MSCGRMDVRAYAHTPLDVHDIVVWPRQICNYRNEFPFPV